MVTKPVWFKGGGLREVLKICLRRSGYAQAGQQHNRISKRPDHGTKWASLPLPRDVTIIFKAIFMRIAILTSVSFVVLFAFALSVCSEDKASTERIVGGECQYKQYQGYAKIVSITSIGRPAGYLSDRYEVKFRFTPNQKTEEPFAQTEGREFLLLINHIYYPGLDVLEKYDIKVGKFLDCTLKMIVRGTCTPMLFDFPFITPEDVKGN
jgi:hypothetical protein